MDVLRTDRNRLLFKVNPTFKFLTVAGLFLLYLFVHNLNTMIWTTVLFIALYSRAAGFSKKVAFGFLIVTLFLSMLSASAMIMYGKGTHVLVHWYLIRVTEESLSRGILLGLRTFLFGLMGYLFASTTQPVLFFYSLMQQLKMPVRYAYSCLAAFRMLPAMAEEFVHIRQAMKVRGLSRKKGAKAFYERFRRYALTLLVQSIRRAQRTAVAMEAKRFSISGSERTYYYRVGWSRYDIGFILLIIAVVAAGFFLSYQFPPTPFDNVLDN
ncbi:MAG: energy-coupling factor transporter transmembrane protein EcfT [Sporolactobacillus sp.]|nr:energy-coupling factor transporter transmembrane protein EcfT [Sporolactobacillus sp.]